MLLEGWEQDPRGVSYLRFAFIVQFSCLEEGDRVYTRYQRASRLTSREEEAGHLSLSSLSTPFSPTAKLLRTNQSPHPLLCSLSPAPGSGLQGLREGQMLVAYFGFQTSKNGSPGEQWPDHLRDVNCIMECNAKGF